MTDTTGTDGKYAFTGTYARKLPAIVPQTETVSMENGILRFTLCNSSPVKVAIFDVKGTLLEKEVLKSVSAEC
jgi:hypothetical protein